MLGRIRKHSLALWPRRWRERLRVWFDEFTLRVGDSLLRSIDHGLANSRYGVVILSPDFFAKEWAQKELAALAAREVSGEKVILPVWHNITAEQIREYSPILADRLAVLSDRGLEHVVEELLRVIKPTHEPVRQSSPIQEEAKRKAIIPLQMLHVVVLKTYHRKFVTVDTAKEWMLKGDVDRDTAERFTLLDLDNGKIALKTSHGRYVTAEYDEPWALRADAQDLGKAQQFILVRLDDGRVAFRTAHNRYITAMNNQPGWNWELRAETDEIRAWEKFTLVPTE